MELIFPKFFFSEEERCGHFVSNKTKKVWATQLCCLEELKRVCEKYNITYFASGGTLLGAVRHKGYIPWDDDIDIMMFYDDYVRFCDVAPKEIKAPFFFQNYLTEPGFGPAMSRIRNSNTTGCTSYDYYISDGDYNCGIFIDIFPLFGVEQSCILLIIQKMKISLLKKTIAGYESKRRARINGWSLKMCLHPYVVLWSIVSLFTNHVAISKRYLKACSCAKSFDQLGLLSFTGFNKRMIWKKEWFEKILLFPFEFTEIPCPKDFDPILANQYGDYMKYVKGGQIHTMMLCDPDTPYKEKLLEICKNRH